MGYTSYSFCASTDADTGERLYDRSLARAASTRHYLSNDINVMFTQQKERKAHETMLPSNALVRECRDSDAHPKAFPVILTLDVTGSMRQIPHSLIQKGLPTLMGGLTERGVNDVSLLFLAIGDHISDSYPLQVAQFESGDEELDMWLTRTFLEGRGGGGYSESYHLAWDFAANHTKTDQWEKRHQKGLLFTIGDEFVHPNLTKNGLTGLYGESTIQESFVTKEALLKEAQEKYDVYHLHVMHTDQARNSYKQWQTLLGQNCISVDDYTKIPDIVSNIIEDRINNGVAPVINEGVGVNVRTETPTKSEEIL
jgi:hypothetical protein